MDNIKISTAQFEHRSNDKAYNLSVIESLSQKAALQKFNVIAFHECSITGYTYARYPSPGFVSVTSGAAPLRACPA